MLREATAKSELLRKATARNELKGDELGKCNRICFVSFGPKIRRTMK